MINVYFIWVTGSRLARIHRLFLVVVLASAVVDLVGGSGGSLADESYFFNCCCKGFTAAFR